MNNYSFPASPVGGPAFANYVPLLGGSGLLDPTMIPPVTVAPQALGGDLTGTTDAAVIAKINGTAVAGVNVASGVPKLDGSGYLGAAQFPALTGDITTSAGAVATTLATVATAGTTGDAAHVAAVTIDAKGRVTSAVSTAIAIPASALTTDVSLGSGVSGVLPIANGGTGSTTGVALPTSYLEGFPVTWVSATSISVGVGKARSSDDTTDLSTSTIVSVTQTGYVSGGGGTDQRVLGTTSAACSGNTITGGGTDFYISRTGVYNNVSYPSYTLTGTMTSSGTSVTGVGTLFTSQLTVGDMIGTGTTYGWSRVTAISSDTSCTIVAAFPGGNISSATVLFRAEGVTVGIGSSAISVVNTIDSISSTWVCAVSLGTYASGSTVTLGAVPSPSSSQAATGYLYVGNVGGSVGPFLSLQRTTPNVNSPGVGFRRIPCEILLNTAANITYFQCIGTGRRRSVYVSPVNVLTLGTYAFWNTLSMAPYQPPTAAHVYLISTLNIVINTGSYVVGVELKDMSGNLIWFVNMVTTSGNYNTDDVAFVRFPALSAGLIQWEIYDPSGGYTSGGVKIQLAGWESES